MVWSTRGVGALLCSMLCSFAWVWGWESNPNCRSGSKDEWNHIGESTCPRSCNWTRAVCVYVCTCACVCMCMGLNFLMGYKIHK